MTRSGRSRLSACHRINQVVHTNYFEVDVTACRVNQMVPADGGQIAISRVHNDVELRVRQFHARGKRYRSAVGRVKGIQFHVACDASCAADPRNERQRLQIYLRFDQGAREAVDCRSDPTSGTPDVRHSISSQKRFHGIDCETIDWPPRSLSGCRPGDARSRPRGGPDTFWPIRPRSVPLLAPSDPDLIQGRRMP